MRTLARVALGLFVSVSSLIASADVTATKSVSGSFIQGTNVTYTIVMTNDMAFAQNDNPGDEFRDPIPAGLVFVSAEASSGSTVYLSTINTVAWNGSIPAGGSVTITIVATINPAVTGAIVNQAQTFYDADNNGTNESSELTDATSFTVLQSGIVSATKSVSGTFVQGTNVTYTIVMTNNMTIAQGDNDGHEFSDSLPDNTTFVSAGATSGTISTGDNSVLWDGSIATGDSVTITIVVAISPIVTGEISNQGSTIFDRDGDGQNDSNQLTDDPSTEAADDPTTFYAIVGSSFEFSAANYDVNESAASFDVTVNRGGGSAGVATVSYTIAAGSAQSEDFAGGGPYVLSFTDGETSKTFHVTIADDAIDEPDQTIALTLTNPSDGSVLDPQSTATITIQDDDAPPTLSIDDVTLTEGDSGSQVATFTITKTGETEFNVTVTADPTLVAGTATCCGPSNDWNGPITGMTFFPSTTTRTAQLLVWGDVTYEPDETVIVTLTDAVNATIADDTGVLTIINDDAPSADLSVTKTDTPDPISAGSLLTYTITVTNNGPADAADVTLTDTIPDGTVYILSQAPAGWSCTTPGLGATGTLSCTRASLASGSSAVFTLSVTVNESLETGTIISNTAVVSTSTFDPNAANDSSTTTTTVEPVTNYTATKSVSGSFLSGSSVTYTVVLTNNMGHAQPNNFSNEFADILPSGLALTSASATSGTIVTIPAANIVTWNGTIPDGDSVTITINATITATSGTISNQGNAILDTDGNGDNETALPTDDPSTAAANDATAFTIIASADVSIATTDTPDPIVAGATLTYTVTVTNAGPNAASDVTMSDAVPEGTTFLVLESTPSDWSCSTPGVGGTGTISCTNPSFASGATAVFSILLGVDSGLADGTVITNTASVATSTFDPNSSNDSATTTTTVQPLSATGFTHTQAIAGDFYPGSTITVTATMTNNMGHTQQNNFGNEWAYILPPQLTLVSAGAPNGTLNQSISGGFVTWNGSIANGTSLTIIVVCTIKTTASGAVSSQSFASIDTDDNGTNETSSPSDDPSTGAEHDATVFTIIPAADLSIAKTDTPDPIVAGSVLTYTVTVTNNGPSAATDVTMSDTVPAGTTFLVLESTPSGWSCGTPGVGGTGTISCTNASFASGGSAVFSILLAVNTGLADGTVITNTATVSSSTFDPASSNNSATTTTTLQPLSATGFTHTKTITGDFRAGGTITITATLTNNMGHDQQNNFGNEWAEGLPSQWTLVSASAPSGTLNQSISGGIVTWNGSIPNGTSITITVVCTIKAGVSGSVSDQAFASIDTDNNGTNETSSPSDDPSTATANDATVITLGPSGTVTGTKSVSGTFVQGTNVIYTIVLTNNMLVAQPNNFQHEFTDIIPTGLTYVSSTASSGTTGFCCSNTFFWDGSLPAGGSVTITITATIGTTASGTISNQGNVIYDNDGGTSNESSTLTDDPSTATANDATSFNVVQSGIVTSTMSVSGTFVQGTNVTYTVVMTNNMSVTQPDNFGHEWTDNLPTGLTLVSVSASSGTTGSVSNIAFWDGSIAAGGSVTLTIVATISSTATGTISNQGQTIFDRNSDAQNESSQVTDDPSTAASYDATSFTVIPNQADLSLTMTYSPSVPGPSDTITYTLVVSNAGPLTATSVVVSDDRPNDATFKSVSTTQGSCTTADPVVCSIGTLANGASATITLAVKAPSSYNPLTNSATATSALTDPTPASASTSISCTRSNGKPCK